jgi:pimeloyl-ACP methyl ester carboxylesterase
MCDRSNRRFGSPMVTPPQKESATDPSPDPVPLRPDAVPASVSVAALRAILQANRPPPRCGVSADNRHVAFVHGLGHDAWDFGPLVARLPDGVVGHAVDLPGFGPGLLDAPPTTLSLAMLEQSVLSQARACPRPPVVVASSLGGHAALGAALAHPEAFSGLCLLAPGGLIEIPRPTQAVLKKYYAVDAIKGRSDDEIVANSRRIFARPHPLGEQLAARKLAWHRSPDDVKQRFALPFSTVIDDVFVQPVLPHVHRLRDRLPILVIFGAGDVVVPLVAGRVLEDRCRARLVILDRVGHCPHLEAPDATAELVFDFVCATFAAAPVVPSTGP